MSAPVPASGARSGVDLRHRYTRADMGVLTRAEAGRFDPRG